MHTPTRRQALRSLAATSAAAVAAQSFAAQGSPKPVNVVLLLADDMGYQDPACFGGTAVKTPHLDALAASGAKMTNFYSGSAVCTPSRASILTGKYPLRFDVRQHFPDDESHLPASALTIPKILQREGYRTGHVGKWHLGGLHLAHARNRERSIPGPIQHGFDDYQCQIEAPFPRAAMGSGRTLFRQGGTCLLRNDRPVGPEDPYFRQHFTELNGSESLRLMERYHAEEKPFFLNLWFLAPHTPYEPAPEPHWSRYRDDSVSHDQRCFRSMVSCLDAQVGRVLANSISSASARTRWCCSPRTTVAPTKPTSAPTRAARPISTKAGCAFPSSHRGRGGFRPVLRCRPLATTPICSPRSAPPPKPPRRAPTGWTA